MAYEEAIRIPMLFRYPPIIKAGTKPKKMVLSIDLASALLDIAGETLGTHLQGKSWVPIFKEKVNDWRSSFLVEYYSDSVFPPRQRKVLGKYLRITEIHIRIKRTFGGGDNKNTGHNINYEVIGRTRQTHKPKL